MQLINDLFGRPQTCNPSTFNACSNNAYQYVLHRIMENSYCISFHFVLHRIMEIRIIALVRKWTAIVSVAIAVVPIALVRYFRWRKKRVVGGGGATTLLMRVLICYGVFRYQAVRA